MSKKSKLNYIYVIWVKRYPLSIKVGISNNPLRRKKEISESAKNSKVKILAQSQIFGAYVWEQIFHTLFFFLNTKVGKNVSGKTEFFSIICLPFALIWVWFGSIIQDIILALFVLFIAYLFAIS